MADVEIINLPPELTPAATDVLALQKAAGGAGSSKKVTVENLIRQGTGFDFAMAYDTTNQAISIPNTFQPFTFSNNVQLNQWTHTLGASIFQCQSNGLYMVQVDFNVERSAGVLAAFGMRATFNSVEVAGSTKGMDIVALNESYLLSRRFFLDASSGAGQNLEIEIAGDTIDVTVKSPPNPGSATTNPSAVITIERV